ncbi:MAG: hypothetical protein QJR05_04550 [Thermoanaerobacterium sp.]|nr:hypothetical protein [Thermoanaerobacterium sp.]
MDRPSYLTDKYLESISDVIFSLEVMTSHHPENIANAVNDLFEKLSIPASVIGWYDPLTNDHSNGYESVKHTTYEIKTIHYFLIKIN